MKKIINETMLNYKILFIVIAICLITGAGVLYRYESKTLIQDGHTHLLQTADMKALLLSNWVKERNNDAAMIMNNARLSNDLHQWLNNRSLSSNKNMIIDRIKTVNHSGTYDAAALLDNGGNVILSITGIVEGLDAPTKKKAVQAAASGNIIWDDLYYCEDCKKEEVNIFVPLYASEKTGSKAIAVLLLQMDARKYLIPLIKTPSEPGKTNEILLLRADELSRFKKTKHLNSDFSDDAQLERLIYSNPESNIIGEFYYNDTKVLASVKKVSDMEWYVVAKVDSKEAYSSLRIVILVILSSLVFLIALLGSLIALVVSNQKKDLYKRQYDIEIEQKALIKHYDYITKYSNDIFFLIEAGGRIVQVNDRALATYGYSYDEILGMNVSDLRTKDAINTCESHFGQAVDKGGTIFETMHKCKDGSIIPVEISLRSLEVEGRRYFQSIIRNIIERKKAEESLQESELRFRTVAQSANDAVIAADKDSRIVFWNNAAGTMYGFNEQEAMRKPITMLMPEQYREAHQKRITMLQTNGEGSTVGKIIDSYGLRKDGSIFPAEYSVSSWQTKEGKYFTAIVRDVTERKTTEEVLRMSEYRYRTTLDAVNEMIHVIDQDYNILLMNKDFMDYCRDNGVCEQCTGKKVFEIFSFLPQSVKDEYAKVFTSKEIVLSEDVNIINGKEIITKTRKIPILEDNKVVRIVTIITDVTDAVRKEEIIKESQEKYKSIFDNSHDGIFIIKGYRFCDCNDALLKMFAMDNKEEMMGKTPDECSPEYQVNGKMSKNYARELIDNAYSGGIMRFEWKHTRKTGEIFDCEISLNRLELKGEHYLMAILRDVTEKKESERKMRDNERRYTIVVEKTGHLVYDYDLSTGMIKWSGAIKEVTGYESGEIERLGIEGWEGLIHPEDKEFVLTHLQACISTISSFDIEYRFKKADGQYIFVSDHGIFLPGKNGKAARMLGTMSDVSERKRMDIALKQSEERYKTLFTDTLEPFSITKKGIIIDVNTAWLKLHKYDYKDEVVGKDVTQIVMPEDRMIIEDRRDQIFSNENERRFEARDLTKTGDILDVEINSSTIYINGEEVIISAVNNVTQRKLSEKKIRELNRRFEYVLGATKTGFDIIDPWHNIVYIDPAWEKEYGSPAGHKCYKYFMDRNNPCPNCGIEEALKTNKTVITEEYLVKEKRWIEVHTIPFQDDEGGRMLAEFNIDITQRKHDQEILEMRQKALQEVYTIATSLDETFQGICNRVAANLAEILKVPHMAVQLLKGGMINVVSYYAEGAMKNDITMPLEGTPCEKAYQKGSYIEINGSLRQLFPKFFLNQKYDLNSYLGVPIKDRKGKVLGLICMYDYKPHYFSQEEMLLLEIFAHYLGYEIDRTEMEVTIREADKGKLLSDIASGVAHEVRNPLHAIQAISEAMAKDIQDNPDYSEYLFHIKTQVNRLSQLMNELLELGKPIQTSAFRRESIYETIEISKKYWKEAQNTIENDIVLINHADPGKRVNIDAEKIQQVIINLIENSAQHSPPQAEIVIEISQQGSDYLAVRIIDKGSGVNPQEIERVFEPFFTTRKKGTGLGLAICKRIIESHGGNILIRNNENLPGCTVQFTLPFCAEEN